MDTNAIQSELDRLKTAIDQDAVSDAQREEKLADALARANRAEANDSADAATIASLKAQIVELSKTPRERLVYGTYQPSKDTTGVVGPLTVVNGDFVSKPGQLSSNLDITGRWIPAPGAELKNSRIQNSLGLPVSVKAFDAMSPGAKMFDCTIYTSKPSVAVGSAVQGRDLEIHRCDIYGTVDGIGPQEGNVSVLGSWIHNLPWYAVDPAQKDGSHNDSIQVHGGGSNYAFLGNSFDLASKGNAAIMINVAKGPIGSVTIDQNWFISPDSSVGSAINTAGTIADLKITNNKFSVPALWKNKIQLFIAKSANLTTYTGNVDTTGAPVIMFRG